MFNFLIVWRFLTPPEGIIHTLVMPSDQYCIPHQLQKEYARYKHMKGWKHLVVYKSGIHALGLYTSRFISRGEMV